MANYYDPFKELQSFVNQTLNQTKSLGMPMDLYRQGDTFVAEFDLPGVDPSSIDIDVEDRTITIRAERRPTGGGEGDEWISRERGYGTFARQITVGRGLALDNVAGEYVDGVLTLTIPVAEEAKPRKVQVQRGSAPRLVGDTIKGQVDKDERPGDQSVTDA